MANVKGSTWNDITSRRLSGEMLLTGHRLPEGSWAAGLWTAPRWSGGWLACACSAGRKWWTVPFRGGPPRGQRWGPRCWCHSLGKPRWHSKCLPGALGAKREKCQRWGLRAEGRERLTASHSLLHFFCTNLSLQAVLYVDKRIESKSWAPEEQLQVSNGSDVLHLYFVISKL